VNPDTVVAVGQQAMLVIAQLSAPALLGALAVGLLIAVFQAATQINEATLSFVPKLLVMAVIYVLAGSWMLGLLVDYTRNLFARIPQLIG
jgi:flagellar biosynthetic protein FliQ